MARMVLLMENEGASVDAVLPDPPPPPVAGVVGI